MTKQTQTPQSTTTSQLKQKLQQHLEIAKQRMEQVKQDIATVRAEDKESIRKMRTEIQARVEAQKEDAKQRRDQVSRWLQDKKEQGEAQVKSWREKREMKHLQKRADRAEEYAVNAVIVAMMDADDAEIAVLEAFDARLDADVAFAPS